MSKVWIINRQGEILRVYADEARAKADFELLQRFGEIAMEQHTVFDDTAEPAEPAKTTTRRTSADIDQQVATFVGLHGGADLDSIITGVGLDKSTAARSLKRLDAAGQITHSAASGVWSLTERRAEAAE